MALRLFGGEALIQVLDNVFRLVQPFDVFVAFVDAQAGHLIPAALFDEFAFPAWVVARIARFDIQPEAAYVAPGSDAKRALLELI